MWTLIPDARAVLKKAWSVRLTIISATLSGAEIAMPYVLPGFAAVIPPRTLIAMAMAVSVGAAVARVVAQPKMSGGEE